MPREQFYKKGKDRNFLDSCIRLQSETPNGSDSLLLHSALLFFPSKLQYVINKVAPDSMEKTRTLNKRYAKSNALAAGQCIHEGAPVSELL